MSMFGRARALQTRMIAISPQQAGSVPLPVTTAENGLLGGFDMSTLMNLMITMMIIGMMMKMMSGLMKGT